MRWRDARAGLIALAIVLALVEGCPIPPPHETLPWQQGYVSLIRPVQRAVMTPFAWIPRRLRFTQRFALFQAAEADRFRLEIRARTAGGEERVVFRAGPGEDGEYASVLTQRRVRGAWNPTDNPTSQYAPFTRWFADRVFRDHADVDVVTFRFARVHIEDGVPRDTGTSAFEVTRARGRP
ncbi:MAG: hypothetical protein M4D80_41995 [Myxococcota bacterium]|nr:hypothetical protein [Deltaproteobacteria bacterium]MDQ3341765.1 hypothetical protein [Myxococcota bacterium]